MINTNMNVFMMKFNPFGYNTVEEMSENISEEFANFIKTPPDNANESIQNVLFIKYDSVAAGLKGNYDDFYIYINPATNEKSIISTNKEKIKAFCGYINRLTN